MPNRQIDIDLATRLDDIEEFAKYVASEKYAATAATYGGFGQVEAIEDSWVSEDPFVKTETKHWLTLQTMIMKEQRSSLTFESSPENDISPETESPFDSLDELRNEDEKVSELVSHIERQLNIDFAERLASRIQFLVEVSKEEYPDEIAIISDSLRNFVGFLQSTPNLNYPDIVLTPSKNIRVQWRTTNNRHFAVEFLPAGNTKFVVFSPDQNHPERTIRLSGLVSVDSLMETVKPHGILSWSSR